ncbi:MAG TPA: hypothetical protein VGM51_06135 [Armatimonadota bacterium]|jgi:hypothetical protein
METTIAAAFQSRVKARDAVSELTHFGLHASDISVAELEIGAGTVFGTAQTLSPGRGSTDISTIVQLVYPMGARGGMPGGIVADTSEGVQASLMDFGLSEEAAGTGAAALADGEVLLAVTVEDAIADAVRAKMAQNEGHILSD